MPVIEIIFDPYFAEHLTKEDKERLAKVDLRKSHRITGGEIILSLKDAAALGNEKGRRGAINWLREYIAKSWDFDKDQVFPDPTEPSSPDAPPPQPRIMWLYGVKLIWGQRNPAESKITYRTFRG